MSATSFFRWTSALLALVLAAAAAIGRQSAAAEPAKTPVPNYSETMDDDTLSTTIRMQVSPAAEPTPALKYRLLVPPVEQVHANAATFYYKAMAIESPDWIVGDDQMMSWLDMPIEELPLEEVKKRIARAQLDTEFNSALNQASRADYCNWGDPIREYGGNTPLNVGQRLRNLARILWLIARVQIAEHRQQEAVETLRLNYALSRNLGHSPTIVQSLIGMAIDGISKSAVRELIADPDSPNLYWALTELAGQPIEVRGGLSYETQLWEFTIHKIVDLEKRALTPGEALDIARQVSDFGDMNVPRASSAALGAGRELALVASALAIEPEARAYLVENGYSAAQVEAMPVLQRGLLYRWRQFVDVRDNLFKWNLLPDEEAGERLHRVQFEVVLGRDSDIGAAFSEALPATVSCLAANLRKQREINLLRTVEALRMHAARSGGWPKTLADVTVVPVPIDPVTGNPFDYSVVGRQATLSAPSKEQLPQFGRQFFAIRYELTLRSPVAGK
jgi:hypothetical protein